MADALSPLDVPDPYGPAADDNEDRLRNHVGEFVLTSIDMSRPLEERINAIRHVVECDPARGMLCLTQICSDALTAIEEAMGDPPGTAVAHIRRDVAVIRGLAEAETRN